MDTLDMNLRRLCVLCVFCGLTFGQTSPVINNLPDAYTLAETTSTEFLLLSIDVTDADVNDDITCVFGVKTTPNNAANSDFRMKYDSTTSKWGIYTASGGVYSYDATATYVLDVECDDGTGNTAQDIYTVYIEENLVPVINNLPDTATLSTSKSAGYTVFHVDVTDPESNQVTLTMVCDPTGCPFEIFDSGQIQLKSDASTITEVGYDVTVTPRDPYGTGIPQTLSVLVTDINAVPQLTNLGNTVAVNENTVSDTPLETATCTDTDAGDPKSFTMVCEPSAGSTFFTVVPSSGVISTTSSIINYETLDAAMMTSFACTVTCSDGQDSSAATVTFDVVDVNEAPAFPQNAYTVAADEGAVNTLLQSFGYTIIDDDVNDTTTFTFDCGTDTGYFLISPAGVLSYSTEYDVDDPNFYPTSVSCTVTVTDSGNRTDTASLAITIYNINDNEPIFSGTPYNWFLSGYSTVGSMVNTATATDADLGTYGAITYSLDQSALLDEYFVIDQSGQVFVKTSITPLGQSVTVSFDVIATDGGSKSTSTTVELTITPTTTTSTTTTTDRYRTFFEDGRNIAWFTTACVLLLLTAVIITWMCFSFTEDGAGFISCRKCYGQPVRHNRNWGETHRGEKPETPPPPPTPPKPVNKPSPAGDLFQFWSTDVKS
ncbi:protocadherin Fat 4-like [Mya arenaria]|uniref:protocadherin Fat 4-like n=1 Tax=Mya arenaria TaxID=6604 RepID=UPI0022E45C6F|nr:protocadherin Fat 4-like [Mya arenaria]